MDVSALDAKKALAIEAYENGEYADAEAAYQCIEDTYHQFGHDEGLLAILFNRFLNALEAGQRSKTNELMGRLLEGLEHLAETNTAYEIAHRLYRLFSEPCPGVDHEATAALVAVASEILGQAYSEPNRQIDMSEIPGPADFAKLGVLEAAARVTRLANELRGRHDAPSWIRGFQVLNSGDYELELSFVEAVKAACEDLEKGDIGRGYRQLVNLQHEICQVDLTLACELGCFIDEIEARGLPKKLAFSPTPPQEERYALTAEIFLGLGTAASESGRATLLASLFFDGAVRACDQARKWISTRHARGAQRAADADRIARLATINSIALRCRGELNEALSALKPSLSRAERAAFGNPLVTIAVLEEAAMLHELLGHREAAHRYYESTILGAMPGYHSDLSAYGRAQVVEMVVTQPERILHGVRGLAGWARTGPSELLISRLELARDVLALSADTLRGRSLTEGHLIVELTAASAGHAHAAPCALEAARVLGDDCAVALSFLTWAEASTPSRSDDERQGQLNLLDNASAAVRDLDWGPFRASVDLRIARILLDRGELEDAPRIESYLRRIGEGFDRPWHAGLGWRLAPFLRGGWSDHFRRLIVRVKELDMNDVGYRLIHSAGRQDVASVPRSGFGQPVSEHFLKVLTARWLHGEDVPFSIRGSISQDASVDIEPRHRRRQSLRRGDLRLVFADVGGDIWAAMKGENGEEITPLGTTRQALTSALERLHTLRAAGDEDGYTQLATELSTRYAPIFGALVSNHLRLFVGLPSWASGFIEVLYTAFGDKLSDGIAVAIDGTTAPVAAPNESNGKRIAICGDAATGRDLQLSTLADDEGYDGIAVHYGDALCPAQLAHSIRPYDTVHLVGPVSAEGDIQLSDTLAAISYVDIADAMLQGQTRTLTMMGPISAEQSERLGRALLGELTCGIVARHADGDTDRGFILELLRENLGAINPRDTMRAWARAYRRTRTDGLPLSTRTAYSLLVHEFL